MLSTKTPALATGFALLVGFALAPGAYAQNGTPPFPPRPASSANTARPCPPDPAKRYEIADPNESDLFAPTGNPDRDFANMMSAHHQEGVDMAKRELAHGKSTLLKAMARRIIKDQQGEIIELDKWSARHNTRVSRLDHP